MHTRFSRHGPADGGTPIRNTFYPSLEHRGAASVVPTILAVVVALVVVKAIAGARHHGGGSRYGRRREAIAQFHRELHAQDEAPGETTKA